MKSKPNEGWSELAERYDKQTSTIVTEELINQLQKKISVLDFSFGECLEIGCGTGVYSEFIGKNAKKITGIDFSKKMIEIAIKKNEKRKQKNVEYKIMDCKNLDFPDKSFDSVLIFNVLHCIQEPEKALKEANRVLKDDGKLIVISYTYEGISFFRRKLTPLRFIYHYGLSTAMKLKKDMHAMSLEQLKNIVEQDFTIEKSERIGIKTDWMNAIFITANQCNK